MKSLLKKFPDADLRRKDVVSISSVGVQAIEMFRKLLSKQLRTPITMKQVDIAVKPPAIRPGRVNGFCGGRWLTREIYIEMIFIAIGEPYTSDTLPKAIAKLVLNGEEGITAWHPRHLTVFYENLRDYRFHEIELSLSAVPALIG